MREKNFSVFWQRPKFVINEKFQLLVNNCCHNSYKTLNSSTFQHKVPQGNGSS